ncbi:MAG TPA: hypothetical protein PLW31_07455 [Bacteroidales bacterium]|nr:hypothetical protein [Bacteroidales bacterium]HPI85011.1 hypothetical protein [Bacteroidales bacterium]HPM92280.1 hypothetical protein [Bacteroidales bacterium]
MYKELLSSLIFGQLQSYGSIAAFPLSIPLKPGPFDYLTLSEALSMLLIRIEEVSESGSVPELKVISQADAPVLILAGEELKGARQNRILNTSILIPVKSELIIPVSCTESGRWSYNSPYFRESGNISSRDIRLSASESVSFSLDSGRGHRSDQGKVWDKIEELHSRSRSDSKSHTRAMDDAYQARKADLDEARRHFNLIPGQAGILFFHSGKVAGLDILSKPGAYARLHDKLVGSYTIDVLDGSSPSWNKTALHHTARKFLDNASEAVLTPYKSPGMGFDHRVQGKHLQGSMLVYNEESIHTCLFSHEPEDPPVVRYYRRREL